MDSQRHRSTVLSVFCVLLLLTGCETMSSVGNSFSDSDSTGDVRRNEASVSHCEFVQDVSVENSPRVGPNATEGMIENKAYAVGGNVVLITRMHSRGAEGKAYKCPDEEEKDEDSEMEDNSEMEDPDVEN